MSTKININFDITHEISIGGYGGFSYLYKIAVKYLMNNKMNMKELYYHEYIKDSTPYSTLYIRAEDI